MRKSNLLAFWTVIAVIGFSAGQASAMCGDVNGDGQVSAGDALAVLQAGIGGHDGMMCDPCDAPTTTTTTVNDGTTTTTIGGSASYNLHVSKMGMYSGDWMHRRGNGRVTSQPAGVDCGSDCDQTFDAGLDVTLTAVAGQDSYFVGWTGDVPPECWHNPDSCTVKMTQDLYVRAMFMWDDMCCGW